MTFNIQILLKWSFVVGFNSILGLYLADISSFTQLAAVLSGIMTWCAIYILLDLKLLKQNRVDLSKRLFISANLRGLSQLTGIDILAGSLAFLLIDLLKLSHFDFITYYLVTFFTGFFLSIVCGLIYLILGWIKKLRIYLKQRRATA